MFGLSFFIGSLIVWFGKEWIVLIGFVLLVGCLIVVFMGLELVYFWIVFVLFGLGWNFGFIGVIVMLIDIYWLEEWNLV